MFGNVLLGVIATIAGALLIGWVVERIGLVRFEDDVQPKHYEHWCNDCEYIDTDPKELPCKDCMQGSGMNDRFRQMEDR